MPGPVHSHGQRRPSTAPAARLLLAALLAIPVSAAAGTDALQFETRRLEIRPAPDQEQVDASFEFTNPGVGPARIEGVASDCACLEAKGPEGEIAPGARGTIKARFKVGRLSGLVEKRLWVTVRQGRDRSRIPLDVAIVVPELVELQPRTLTWDLGDRVEEQQFKVNILGDEPIRLVKVECTRPTDFEFRVETRVEGREYLVHARPSDADRPMIAAVHMTTDCRIEKYRTRIGFVHVRRK